MVKLDKFNPKGANTQQLIDFMFYVFNDMKEMLLESNKNVYDEKVGNNELILKECVHKIETELKNKDTELKNKDKLKDFYNFMLDKMTPKQQKDYINKLMEL